jgi:2,3-bisphosphoglycerate-independent phosphoglycerate mutase
VTVMPLRRLAELAQPATGEDGGKIVLLVADGVGDLRTAEQPRSPLEAARIPNLDGLAAGGSLGRILPVAWGITPGSGPGHLALFGYDPLSPEADIGRGVLEALGAGVDVRPGDVAVRGNFATADPAGQLVDRRAGRIPTAESAQVVARMRAALPALDGIEAILAPGEGHRFVLLLRGAGLSAAVDDTDPQQIGVPPLPARATSPEAERTAAAVQSLVDAFHRALAEEPKANRVLLRGFSSLPDLPPMPELYQLRCGAFAGYPLYRGVASACGMAVLPCGKSVEETVAAAVAHWDDFDFLFLHVKYTDMAGEDGDFPAKVRALEAIDGALPRLLERRPRVVAVTGDHSTPVPMKGHSWHPVPLLLAAPTAFVDSADRFDEVAALHGHLGTFPSCGLLALLLAHAGRLQKFGA